MATDLPVRLSVPADLDLAAVAVGLGLAARPGPPSTVAVSGWDTADRRLARYGAALSCVDDEWTLRLPDGEQRVSGGSTVPAELRGLVTGWVRTAELDQVQLGRVGRTTYELVDAGDGVVGRLVEERLADSGDGPSSRTVTVLTGPRRLVRALREAGAERLLEPPPTGLPAAAPDPALGDPVLGDPVPGGPVPGDPAEPEPLSPGSSSGAVLGYAMAVQAGRLVRQDLAVRRGEPDAVHQMRVCCRRLRGMLRTFRPLVAADWAADLSAELAWLAGSLGDARDLEVLRERVADTSRADPLYPVDPAAVARIDAALAAREQAGQAAAASVLDTRRYAVLLERVVAGAQAPPLAIGASAPAREAVRELVADAWRELARKADRLSLAGSDSTWHRARILGKRARYALETAEPAFGAVAGKLARRLAGVQDLLGEHQDAAVAADTLLAVAREHPDDTELVLACGRLAERERAAVLVARAAFADRWPALAGGRAVQWLRG
jgi:CHAD domain-containing protein